MADHIRRPQDVAAGTAHRARVVGGGDCMRLAVAAAYQVPYDDTPAIYGGPGSDNAREFQHAYENWAARHGYRWWFSDDVAPCHLPRWIASVPGLDAGGTHAVVMEHDRLWLDPSSLSEGKVPAYSEVPLRDVLAAKWLEREDTTGLRGRFLPINGKPTPVRLSCIRGRVDDSHPHPSVRVQAARDGGR